MTTRNSGAWSSSIDGPETGSGEFEEVGVGIAEVDAAAAEGPSDLTFDVNGVSGETRLPSAEIACGNGKSDVNLAGAAVGRDDASRKNEGSGARATLEEQEDVAAGHGVGAEAFVSSDALEFENAFVEVGGAVDVVDVESGFENTGDGGHSSGLRQGDAAEGISEWR